jgi:S1-C subfamily serine protease
MVFGVRCADRNDNNGVTVTRVFPGYSGARAGLKKGDVILEIDEQRIWDIQDYSDAVNAATGKIMRLKVRSVRNGEILYMRISLQ